MNKYETIMTLPHYELRYHKRMSPCERAAQFSSFAALTGYDQEIKEAKRLTVDEIKPSEDQKNLIDMKLQIIKSHIEEKPLIKVTYFKKDDRKEGGEYCEYIGFLKKIDEISRVMFFTDNHKIQLQNILEINSSFFNE